MKTQLGIVINEDFEGSLHELLANGSDGFVKGGREHHHLLLMGSELEDGLDIGSHV
jgi:hypothetical protein